MNLVTAYMRRDRAADVMRALHRAAISGITAYEVHGMSGETANFLHSNRPFEVRHLPEAIKLEVVCPEDSVEAILELLAGAARTGKPGDGIVTVHKLDRVIRIRELQGVGDQP
jgi:nitrogen regulatory protein PII